MQKIIKDKIDKAAL